MQDKPLVCECGKPFSPGQALRCRLNEDEIGYMPRGPNVATSLFIVSNAKLDLSYFCMWACCPVLKSLVRLSGQLESA